MSSSRNVRPDPGPAPGPAQTRPRPSDERAQLAAEGRTTRTIALIAVAVAVGALGLAAWRALVPTGASCQQAAWDTTPGTKDLPAGWSISASQYDILRKSMTMVGAAPADDTTAQAVVYATITCYPEGAADSVTRSADAATAAGQVVTARDDLGDQAFSAIDDSNAEFLQLRHGDVVVYLAASGDANPTEVDMLASAFDKALGGDGGEVAVGTPDAASPGSSDDTGALPSEEVEPSTTPAAPDLEARLPAAVGDLELSVDSVGGEDVLSDDQGGRPIIAALRAAGAPPADLRLAQAYDNAGASDLLISALAVKGVGDKALTSFVLDAWLQTSGAGITRTPATVGGRQVTKVDYGDAGIVDYVLPGDGVVYIVSTADKDLAGKALAALP
jgi:hypothetical protein